RKVRRLRGERMDREPALGQSAGRADIRAVNIPIEADADKLERAVAAIADGERGEITGRHGAPAAHEVAVGVVARGVHLIIDGEAKDFRITAAVIADGNRAELARRHWQPALDEVGLGVKLGDENASPADRAAKAEHDRL